MTLTPGTKIGSYEILGALGAGGMGEVYRARDTRLGRDVAIKALPPAFALDPERLARFEREAKLLASLSHPNIAGIYAVEEKDGARLLVMELVEGDTLAQRLARGPMAVDEALTVAAQVASGIEAAHEAGVIHRDLKPGNIMLRPDGTVKVLDFGLARGPEQTASQPDLTHSPTMASPATVAGMVLGTAAYMSPEQAKGRPVDRRADIWSFGVVLFELLTGRQVFRGETASETLAGVMKDEIPWSRLPADIPPRVRQLLERCLTRDPQERLQSIGEARILLKHAHEPDNVIAAPARSGRSRRVWAPWLLLALLAALVVARMLLPRAARVAVDERRLELAFTAAQRGNVISPPAISPDGHWLALVGVDSTGTSRVWLRSMAAFDFQPLDGTEGAMLPFWSPDSRSIGFFANRHMLRRTVPEGVAETIVEGIVGPRGASWGLDGTILYTPNSNASIWRVPAAGGTPQQITQLDTALVDGSHRFPVWLPDGEHFLFTIWSNNSRALAENGGIYVASVRGGAPVRVIRDPGSSVYVPTGYIAFMRSGNLLAVPFDARKLHAGTEAVAIAEHVRFRSNAGILMASASTAGDFVFDVPLDLPPVNLVWLDRHGMAGAPLSLHEPVDRIALSPDGTRFAAQLDDPNGLGEVWLGDLERSTLSRFTRNKNDSYAPVWSPDGQRLAFNNRDTGTEDLYVQLASGTRPKERVWEARTVDCDLSDWSSDGRSVLFTGVPRQGADQAQVWLCDMQTGAAHVLLQDEFDMSRPKLSPDGRWLAYVSNESGREEVYVRSFPDLEHKWRVSVSGGDLPHWRADGRELVFLGGANTERSLWAAAIAVTPAGLAVGEPARLFTLASDQLEVAPSADHARFLTVVQPGAQREPPLRLVLGWRPGATR